MPVQPTYPGVYVEELPSGVHTIMGVATSITAFIGRAARGPVNKPIMVGSSAEFERVFGGLAVDAPMTYAVRDYFQNGGSQAIVVRLFKGSTGYASVTLGKLKLTAAEPGAWGNQLRVSINKDGITAEVAERFGVAEAKTLFNLIVGLGDSVVERIANVTLDEGPRRMDRVLANESRWLRVADGTLSEAKMSDLFPAPKKSENGDTQAAPAPAWKDLSGGADSPVLAAAEDFLGSQGDKTGLYALENADLFNLLCIPPDARGAEATLPDGVLSAALAYCVQRRAMLIVDPPAKWKTVGDVALNDLALNGTDARNAAVYFPRLISTDPLRHDQRDTFVPCGAVAGVMARTDAQRGVWKAPAGLDAGISGAQALALKLTDEENGRLNPQGVNCLRTFPVGGTVVWGARTLRGSDQLADDYKYVPVRRLTLFIEESLYRGTHWAVFEPNDEPLWGQLRLNIGAFMHNLFRQGAFQGASPKDAYFVKCDHDTTTQNDIDMGVVNIVVGFAPLKPAEFVVLKLQQMAGAVEG